MTEINRLQLALVGTSFRQVGFEELGRLTLGPENTEARRLLYEAFGADELVYLATCNRVECYLAAPDLPDPQALRECLMDFFRQRGVSTQADWFTVRTGGAVIQHLFAVASSLDSLVAGETDIVLSLIHI